MEGTAILEIEAKFPLADEPALLARLAKLGVRLLEPHVEVDHYFNAPDRDFAQTGEAFRLRRVDSSNRLTYKAPKRQGPAKTRPELEIDLRDGDEAAAEMQQLLTYLGYRPVTTVRKQRRIGTTQVEGFDLNICLDIVDDLGPFVELEILAEEDRADTAASVVVNLAEEWGLGPQEMRSYLRMTLQRMSEDASGSESVPVVDTITALRQIIRRARALHQRIGLVPTMGALHRGHVALIEAARREADFVVVSIFVNPTQFGPGEDLDRYPRPFEQDCQTCAEAGASLIFAPRPEVMYPLGFTTWVEVPGLSEVLCGPSRPSHFRGVATVVLKLLNMVQPDVAIFGEKDAQQARIIQRMVTDLDVPTTVRIEPTVREEDGLALSSRNKYLNAEQRRHATVLYRALNACQIAVSAEGGGERDVSRLEALMVEMIEATPLARLDYAQILDAETLGPIVRLERPALAAVAVDFEGTRLIDNMMLTP